MRSTTRGRPPAPTSIITAASASCRRRRARTSRRPSTFPPTSSPRAAGASTRQSAPGTSRIHSRASVGPCATSWPTRRTEPTPCSRPQRYPDLRLYPGGPPLPPYDVTAHTLPLLMGVTAVAARDSLHIALSAPVEPPAASPGYPGLAGPEAPRVGLYRSYAASIDEGWTRWVFDTWKVPYVSVVDSVVRAGKLREHFEVIVLPDQSPHELFDGLPRQY